MYLFFYLFFMVDLTTPGVNSGSEMQKWGKDALSAPRTMMLKPNTEDTPWMNTFKLPKWQFRLLLLVTTAAKKTLVKAWKTAKLCLTDTTNGVMKAMINGKIEVTLQDRISVYSKMWQPWIVHFLPPGFEEWFLEPWPVDRNLEYWVNHPTEDCMADPWEPLALFFFYLLLFSFLLCCTCFSPACAI